ncbi:hypothetical protein [Anaerolinea thermophila]|nr:hypothetical protein [Anaerolinea thermophila]
MKQSFNFLGMLATILALALTAGLTQAQANPAQLQAAIGDGFTYQGMLNKGGNPYSGVCDFQFSLWNASNDGTQIGTTQEKTSVQVTNGIFTISNLDFGAYAFPGDERWLEIAVKCTGDAGFTTLTPRQPLTAVPYALYSKNSWSTSGNKGTVPGTHFLGTTDFQPLELRVNNQRALLIQPKTSSTLNIIAGHAANTISSNVVGATIAGGGGNDVWKNEIKSSGDFATISGGKINTADGNGATISGGTANTANGQAVVIGGGNINTAVGYAATVSGGGNNQALKDGDTVGGGMNNTANGSNSVISGGAYNTTTAVMAAIPGGYRAKADHFGQMAFASGSFSTTGDAQTSTFVMRNSSTGSSSITLYLDGTSALLTIADGRTLTFDILIAGRSNTGESAGYHIQGIIENVDKSLSFIGTPTITILGEDDPAWNVRVIADDVNDTLNIQCKGNDEVVRWVATVRTAEVFWGSDTP